MGVQTARSSLLSGREGCWLLPRRRTWLHLGTPAVAILPWVTSPNIIPAHAPSQGSGLDTPPMVCGPVVGLAVPARPRLARKGPCVGVQPPLSSLPILREGCWLLPRRRTWLRLGTPAVAMLPVVTCPSVSPPLCPARAQVLPRHLRLHPRGRIGHSCSTMLSQKRAARGSAASP